MPHESASPCNRRTRTGYFFHRHRGAHIVNVQIGGDADAARRDRHVRPRWKTSRLVRYWRQSVVRLIRHPVVLVFANDCTSDRSHLRSSIASAVQSPFLKFPFLAPRGAPGLNPPCRRHRFRPRMAGRWHGVPARVLAPHFGARPRSPSLVSSSFMGLISKFVGGPLRLSKAAPIGK
jgi:hypothetical protein